MDLDYNIPEEYIDSLVQDFAYDPVRLPFAQDPCQVLYNRRTLEIIWDKDAINPYTRQPFHIIDAIPQTELKQQMAEYILNNSSITLSLGLEVIPDYTQILNESDMTLLLNELVLAGFKCMRFQKKKKKRQSQRNRNRKLDAEELEQWKSLWKKLNLVRLYCQYRAENSEMFSAIKGYKFLFQLISRQLFHSCREYSGSSSDDAKEVCKEVARIVDVIGGLKENDLLMAPAKSVLAFVRILFDLGHSEYSKMQSMVLRIYSGILKDCDYYLDVSMSYMVEIAFHVLAGRENPKDLVNEDLYNGLAILRVAWMNNIPFFPFPLYGELLCIVVTVCISRLEELHDVQTSGHENDNGEVNKNINLISMALDQGLLLIHYLITSRSSEKAPDSYASKMEILKRMGMAKQIVRMVELILAGNKFFQSSQVYLALKITVALGLNGQIRSEHGQVFRNLLVSKFMDEYDTKVKRLIHYIVLALRSWLSQFSRETLSIHCLPTSPY